MNLSNADHLEVGGSRGVEGQLEVGETRPSWEGDDVVLLRRRIADRQEAAPDLGGAVYEDEAVAGAH